MSRKSAGLLKDIHGAFRKCSMVRGCSFIAGFCDGGPINLFEESQDDFLACLGSNRSRCETELKMQHQNQVTCLELICI